MNLSTQIIDDWVNLQPIGQQSITLSELRLLVTYLAQPKSKAVFIGSKLFVSVKPLPKMQFCLSDTAKATDLSFINSLELAEPEKEGLSLPAFLWLELTQATSTSSRWYRVVSTLIPLVAFNGLIFCFGSEESIASAFASILAGLSIFVAIFAVFITSNEYLTRKKLELFASGRLSYYFSIDRNITLLGAITILLALVGVIIKPDKQAIITGNEKIASPLAQTFFTHIERIDVLSIIILNICLTSSYIILRSLVEFYIKRPSKYILGDLKAEYLEDFTQ